jgi:hypothetical protein
MELYVYYRLPLAAVPQALAELQTAHAALRSRWPLLTSRCLQRVPEPLDPLDPLDRSGEKCDGIITFMEIHHQPEGLDAASMDQMCAMLSPWPSARVGDRHVEAFAPLPASGVL